MWNVECCTIRDKCTTIVNFTKHDVQISWSPCACLQCVWTLDTGLTLPLLSSFFVAPLYVLEGSFHYNDRIETHRYGFLNFERGNVYLLCKTTCQFKWFSGWKGERERGGEKHKRHLTWMVFQNVLDTSSTRVFVQFCLIFVLLLLYQRKLFIQMNRLLDFSAKL